MWKSVKKLFAFVFGGLAMLAVALGCAFLSMRLAIHGREVAVPNLAGMTDEQAAAAARDAGLNLSVENRFYSPAIATNHILSQSPAAGSKVRSGWQVRVTESLGAQTVSVPDVTGLAERPASLMLQRLQLGVGVVAHLPAPGPAGAVLAQSPPPNARGLDGPQVSLLVADDADDADTTPSFVMPNLIGMSLSTASLRLSTAGLHIATAQAPEEDADPDSTDPAIPPIYVAPAPTSVAATVTSQSPAPGHRVKRGEAIHVSLSH